MNSAGIDMGAKTIKIVILCDGEVKTKIKGFAGLEPAESADYLLNEALKTAGLTFNDMNAIVATGTGRSICPHTTSTVTEAVADAKGVFALFPDGRTLIDVGAEEGRGIRLTKEGQVMDFAANEKCAAGSGAFTESMARALEVDIGEFGRLSLQSTQTIPMNAQCTVFSESEVVSLIHSNTSKADIARAVHDAIASRIAAMVRRVGLEKEVVLIGGVAYNAGFVESLKRTLALENILIPHSPEYVSALGAALIGQEQRSANTRSVNTGHANTGNASSGNMNTGNEKVSSNLKDAVNSLKL